VKACRLAAYFILIAWMPAARSNPALPPLPLGQTASQIYESD